MDDDEAPPYCMTTRQEDALDAFEGAVEERVKGEKVSDHQIDQLCLALVMALLDHQLRQSHYDNPIISALAVMGQREGGGWVRVLDYTSIYAAVIKGARMMVLYQSWQEREDEVAKLQGGRLGEEAEQEAREMATPLFQIVRDKVQRFMIKTSGRPKALPTPMDWMFEALTYGKHVQFDTPADGKVDWVGEQIRFQKIKFTMDQLSEAPHALTDEARTWLAKLAEVDDLVALPRIPWARLEDDHSEAQGGKDWVMTQISESKARVKAVRQYGKAVDQFRERLWMPMHMVSWQPARTTEILGIRMVNTVNGGVRNIMAHNQMMCFVTSYHKTFRATGQAKVIHRYLPREVGELLVWYLWLALPVWQQVRGMVKGGRLSAFLWSDEVVGSAEEDGGIGQDGALTISAWRHIAIAISNRKFAKGFDNEGDEDDDDEDDDIWDLQAAHSTHVAGMVYARGLQQGMFGTEARRDQFRAISRQWHHFLDFGAEDRKGAGLGRRRREAFETQREEARFQRLRRLCQVDPRGQLRTMMGEGAAFRGQQERVIRAICRGMSPIVQVTGTGGGKSLSFMLPAFCSADGTTIVVIPLVSLREDLYRRCDEAGICTHIWGSQQGMQTATLVFVTPESAVTKGFHDFVNRLLARQALDRVVVDECHVLLDGDAMFRPQLLALGATMQQWGVQTVFLTATLPPADEAAFYRAASLSAKQVVIFRQHTTRKNIGYRVEVIRGGIDEEDSKVCQIVRQWLNRHEGGRAIVYAGTIARVEALADTLVCERYHSKVTRQRGR
ncbi:DEAD/DEAH box helicase [Hirsutella rhossiliensis]|uniref:DEAD/DEAH box helicase domain-containing protein n=1 Tax=Hirsutella rhossiliensis TaxID=111463 RepID=A0A9P8SD38_9HYPO|nr:DEAD/DEAH box helicase domain-containing protein [Hirsutella rhossiliensis]KAH0958201.1 DEAD/DEAH box helicase domain-containing protein [Hirsutella rhossiliensis]